MSDSVQGNLVSSSLFYSIFEKSPSGIIIIESYPECVPVMVNESACRMLGYDREEFMQLRLDSITHPDDKPLEHLLIQNIQRKEIATARLEKRYLLNNGNVLWVELQMFLISDTDKIRDSIAFIIHDISEKKEKDKALKEIYEALDQSSLVSITDEKGTIVRVNKRFCDIAQYSADELLGQNHRIINSGNHSQAFWADFWKTIRNGEVWRGEIKNKARDGSEYWVDTVINPIRNEAGTITHYLSIRQDITKRKENESLLVQTNLRLAQIEQFIDLTTDAITVTNDVDGQFVYINREAAERFGIPQEQCHKFTVLDIESYFKSLEDWKKRVEQVKKAPTFNTGVQVNIKTGKKIQAEITVRHVVIKGMGYIIAISRDVTDRKKNEMLLRESEARLAEAQRIAKLGYWELDLTNNKFWWSDEQYQLIGIPKADIPITLERFVTILHPDDREVFLKMMSNAVANRSEVSTTYRIVRPNGYVRVIQGKAHVTTDDQGRPVKVSGVNQDVTDRVLAEKALAENEQILRKAQAVAKIGSWKMDIKNDSLIWSDETYRIFNVPLGKSLTSIDFYKHVHPDEVSFLKKSWDEALKGAKYDVVHRIIVNNEIKWVRQQAELTFDEYHNLILGIGTVQDITDQKILQETNSLFSQSQLVTGLGSWRLSFVTNELFWSDNLYELHGLQKKTMSITYEDYLNIVYPDDREQLKSVRQDALLKKVFFEAEYRVEISPDELRWLSAKGKVITDTEGRGVEIYGIIRDITQEKMSSEKIISAQKQAEEANLIKDEFLSVMSHEIRTPLNSVIGLSNLLLKRNPREDQLEILKTLKASADNLLYLVNDILDFNKIRAGKVELELRPFSLGELLQRFYASFKLSTQENDLNFIVQADPQIPDLLIGDTMRLSQIFNNLLSNAIKFTHQGYVKMIVNLKEISADTCTVLFHVEDSGVGIASNKLNTIFIPFQQSERDISRKYGGTGLGLSIVKTLVEIMNGRIDVHSVVEQGSVFTIELTFPISKTDEEPVVTLPPLNTERQRKITHKKLHVLYVEDVDSNRFLIENLLLDYHIHCISVSSGRAALRLTKSTKFDVILMDLQMPVMDGYQTTEKIRKQADGKNRNTNIIAFTAEPYSEALRTKIIAGGFQDVVTKPFSTEVLLNKLLKDVPVKAEETNTAGFSFNFYERAFNNDKEKLKEIKKTVMADFRKFDKKVLSYSTSQNLEGIRAEIHKMKPIMKNLGCTALYQLVDKQNWPVEYNAEIATLINDIRGLVQILMKDLANLKY